MGSLLLALGASLAWGFGDFFGPLVSRRLGSLRVIFWGQAGGVCAIALAVAVRGEGPRSWAVLFASAAALGGVALASIEHHEGSPRVAAGVGLALLAALGFGFYFPWMHAAGKVDFWWASLVFRSTALLLLVAVVSNRRTPLRLRPRDLLIAAAVGIADTFGNVLFAASSGHGLVSLTSVLASLYPVVTVLLAATVLHENVARWQKSGIVLTLTGVVLISF